MLGLAFSVAGLWNPECVAPRLDTVKGALDKTVYNTLEMQYLIISLFSIANTLWAATRSARSVDPHASLAPGLGRSFYAATRKDDGQLHMDTLGHAEVRTLAPRTSTKARRFAFVLF